MRLTGLLGAMRKPQTPADLDNHKLIVLVTSAGPLSTFHFVVYGPEWQFTVPMSQTWETNNGALARAWTLAGRSMASHARPFGTRQPTFVPED